MPVSVPVDVPVSLELDESPAVELSMPVPKVSAEPYSTPPLSANVSEVVVLVGLEVVGPDVIVVLEVADVEVSACESLLVLASSSAGQPVSASPMSTADASGAAIERSST